jgi:hypothetical protein
VPAPGWYPDPTGDYEHRYWEGAGWTDRVSSYGEEFVDPPGEPELPAHERALWAHDGNALSTHRAWIEDGFVRGRVKELALWMIEGVEVTINSGQRLKGTGRVALKVAYPGYTGRTHWVMTGVPGPREVAALFRKWANRNRRQLRGPAA